MRISDKQYAQSLYELIHEKDETEIKIILKDFIKILIKNNDTSKIQTIIAQFEKIWSDEQGVIEAEVVTTGKLDQITISLLKNYIIKLSKAKKINIKEKTDKKILGGVIIKYQDKIYDSSLKTRLRTMKEKMVR